jgi:TolB-like protein
LRTRLTGLLWSSRESQQARASLRQALHELQEALGEAAGGLLWADRNHLALHDEALWVDAQEVTRPSLSNPEALDLLRGELLEDLDGLDPGFDGWLATERERLRGIAHERSAGPSAARRQPEPAVAPASDGLASDTGASSRHEGAPFQRAGGIRLGVMPMRSLDGQGDDPLSLGLAEEITNALSRFRWISCVASASLATLAGEPADGKHWQRLGLDFMLDGTVQRSGGRVRITSRLLDMRENGAVIWVRRFDREMTDIFVLQDEIAAQTVAQVDPELLLHEGERAGSRPPPPDSTAYELMLRAIPAIYRLEQTGFLAAGEMLRAAIDIDPGHAASHAWLAYWHLLQVGQGWTDDKLGSTAQAGALADRAVTLDPGDARGLTLSGHVRAFLERRPEEGILRHQRALSLNPNLPMAWAFTGQAHTYLGRHDEAIQCIGQAQRLSPFDPHGFFFDTALMMAHLLKHDHDAALRIGRRAMELNPGFSSSYKGVLAVLGHLNRTAEAGALLARLKLLEPRLTLADAVLRSPIVQPDDRAYYHEGLRLAGLR